MDKNTYEHADLAAQALGDYPGRSEASQWSFILGQLDGAAHEQYEHAYAQMYEQHERTFKLDGTEEYITFSDGSVLRSATGDAVVLDGGIKDLLVACQDLLVFYGSGKSAGQVSLGHLSSVAADSAKTIAELEDLLECVKFETTFSGL
jgi:hypothetical protein